MELGDIGYLKAKNVKQFGAFLEWKEEQDILLPSNEQITEIRPGQDYIVTIRFDSVKDNFYATQKIEHYLQGTLKDKELTEGEEVKITPYAKTPLGIKASINKKFRGLLYKNEIFQDIKLGESYTAYIKNVRSDGKIDLSLQRQTYKQVTSTKDKILQALERAGGFLPLNDKSSPGDIRKKFGISKNVFKQTIGALYKQRKIKITDKGIRLV